MVEFLLSMCEALGSILNTRGDMPGHVIDKTGQGMKTKKLYGGY